MRFFGSVVEAFAAWCVERGLVRAKIRRYLASLRRLRRWFYYKQVESLEDLSEDDIANAQANYRNRAPMAAEAAQLLGDFLKSRGCLGAGRPLCRVKRFSWRRYRDLPVFGGLVDDFARWCVTRGFASCTIRAHLHTLRHLEPWLQRRRLSVDDLSGSALAEAWKFFRRHKRWDCRGIRRLGEFLKDQGRLKPDKLRALTRSEKEVARYTAHLRKDCAFAQGTIVRHDNVVRRFLRFLGMDKSKEALRKLTLGQIHSFLRRVFGHYARQTMAEVVGAMRRFLRFEFMSGVLREPLHLRLESTRIYRQERLARALPWPQLRSVLELMDRSTPTGRRDYAMLLLAASYGLRCSEVAALSVDDIDWRARLLRVSAPKTGQNMVLPLTDGMANALVDYLRRGRPVSDSRRLFLRVRAPAGVLGAHGVACSLKRAARATGVSIQTTSFHALRHAFALRLLRRGAALDHISGVLGHRDPNTTSTYLRLDVEDLRRVALPAPEALKTTASPGADADWRAPHYGECGRKCRPAGSVTRRGSKGFESFLARRMEDFIALNRALGRSYRVEEWILRTLDFYLARHHGHGRVFTATMFKGWVRQQAGVSPSARSDRMALVRKFLLHLSRASPRTYVPDPRTFPKRSHQAPCLLCQNDVARLLAAAIQKPRFYRTCEHPLRPRTIHLALLLLYCCGLRRGELLKLRLADIDTAQQVLRIRETKFHKTRLVPLSASLSNELRKYLRARRACHAPMDGASALIWSGRANHTGGAYNPSALRANWCQVCRYAGVLNHRGCPPRIHDLRHSFAVAVLQRAYRTGQDPQNTLPRLARYMGHVDFAFTHHYLKFTEPLRLAASERFHRLVAPFFFAPNKSKSSKRPLHELNQRQRHLGGSLEKLPRGVFTASKGLQRQHHPQLPRQFEAAAAIYRRQTRPRQRVVAERSERRQYHRLPRLPRRQTA
jgi:site-specific recombinase XerD